MFFVDFGAVVDISQLLAMLILQQQPRHLIVALARIPPRNPKHELPQIGEAFVRDIRLAVVGVYGG